MEERRSDRLIGWIRRHRRAADVLIVLAVGVLAASFGLRVWDVFSLLPPGISPWWSLLPALAASAFVPFKRRYPTTALAGTAFVFTVDLFTTGGLGSLVAVLDALYAATLAAGAAGRRRILYALCGVVVILSAVALMVTANVPLALFIGLQAAMIFGTDYWWATSVAQAHELAELHRARAEDAERLAERDREMALRAERETMARELHDLVAGHVSAVAIRAEAALAADPGRSDPREAMRAVRDSSLEAHRTLRSMISVLRGGDGGEISPPRLDMLDAFVAGARDSGLDVTVIDRRDGPLPVPVDQTAARIVQEALANCARHASGSRVTVTIDPDAATVRVQVDSHGGSPSHPELRGSGWGLETLRERTQALGGRLRAGPRDGGWSVAAELPLQEAA